MSTIEQKAGIVYRACIKVVINTFFGLLPLAILYFHLATKNDATITLTHFIQDASVPIFCSGIIIATLAGYPFKTLNHTTSVVLTYFFVPIIILAYGITLFIFQLMGKEISELILPVLELNWLSLIVSLGFSIVLESISGTKTVTMSASEKDLVSKLISTSH